MLDMKTKDIVLTALFVALMVVSAKISIPFPFVPLTFQLVIAVASGIFIGPKYGPLSTTIYLALGLAGIPVFAYGGGYAYIFNPTFGYLLSFPLASFVTGLLWRNSTNQKAFSVFVGILTTYLIGVPYLWMVFTYIKATPIDFITTINYGFWPFILKDIVLGIVLFLVALPVTKYLDSKEAETANS